MGLGFNVVVGLIVLFGLRRTSWGRTKLSVFFSKVIMPWVLEPALVLYLKHQGPRTVLKHWRQQMARPSSAAEAAGSGSSSGDDATYSAEHASFRIELATVVAIFNTLSSNSNFMLLSL